MKTSSISIEIATNWKDEEAESKAHECFLKEIKELARLMSPMTLEEHSKSKLTIKEFEVDKNVQKRKEETNKTRSKRRSTR